MAPVSEKQSPTQPRKGSSLRRSQRVLLAVPIVLMGSTEEGKPFSEETITHVVNAHGALVALGTKSSPVKNSAWSTSALAKNSPAS
jgi:hypothetical protein